VSAFAAATIATERLLLVPLRPEDADEMVGVLADPRLHQFISEAARALVGWLDSRHVHDLVAHIHPDHVASARVAMRAGFQPTHDQVDGEQVWRRQTSGPSRCRRS
jgi:RimJ/RimL family protein N-acetyltransferase